MQVSLEYKINALLKGGTETVQRVIESLRPLRESFSTAGLRERGARWIEKPSVQRLVDPHALLSPRAALQIAAGVALASMALAIALGTVFDGVLDVHARIRNVGVVPLVFNLVISWGLTAVALWLAARIADGSSDEFSEERDVPLPTLREFAIMVGVARVPTLAIAIFVAALPQPQVWGESLSRGLLVVPLFAWFALLLYNGFRHVTGFSHKEAVVPFLAGLVIAQAVIKVLLGAV